MADSSSTSVTLGQNNDGAPDGTTIVTNGAGRIAVADPIVPVDGTQNITGALTVSGATRSTQYGVTSDNDAILPFGIAGVKIASSSGAATVSVDNGSSAIVTGNFADGGTAIGVVINNSAALANAAAKLLSVQNNSVEKLGVSKDGAVTPSSDVSGASKLLWVGRGTYVIDFGAFTAGIDQTSAQALTGVAFGDCLSIGCSADQSATIGQMTAMVTSAGNIVITISPVSTTSTANPASATYTVTAIRTA